MLGLLGSFRCWLFRDPLTLLLLNLSLGFLSVPWGCDSISETWVIYKNPGGGFGLHQGFDIAFDFLLLTIKICPCFLALEDLVVVCGLLGAVVTLNTSQNVNTLFVNFNAVLVSQLTHVCLHLLIQPSKLLVQRLLLPKTSSEHLDLVPQLIVFKLVFVGLAADLLIAFLTKLFELTILAIFQPKNNFFGLVQL